jgi:hypothetical protein
MISAAMLPREKNPLLIHSIQLMYLDKVLQKYNAGRA